MGATGWNCFVPYEADAEAALQHLRQQVFKEGKYGTGILGPDRMKTVFEHLLARSPHPAQMRQQIEEAMARLAELRQRMPPEPPKPDTIDKLLEQRAENGTHSILDIQHVAPEREDFCAVSPMPAERLKGRFLAQTNQPGTWWRTSWDVLFWSRTRLCLSVGRVFISPFIVTASPMRFFSWAHLEIDDDVV